MTKGVKMLIVEDDSGIRDLLVFFLNFAHERGVVREYEICPSAEKAWERIVAQDGDLDVVFTDVHMLGMGGLALVEKIKKEFPHIKCIVVSALDCRDEAMACGADDFVCKPYNPMQIGSMARKVLSGAAE